MHGSAALVLWLLSACLADSRGSHCNTASRAFPCAQLIQSTSLFFTARKPKEQKEKRIKEKHSRLIWHQAHACSFQWLRTLIVSHKQRCMRCTYGKISLGECVRKEKETGKKRMCWWMGELTAKSNPPGRTRCNRKLYWQELYARETRVIVY